MSSPARGERRPGHSRPLVALVLARLREFWRESAAIFWVYGFPLLLVLALGVAFRNRPADKFAVVIASGATSPQLEHALSNDKRFNCKLLAEKTAYRQLRVGKADLMISPNETGGGGLRYLYDPSRPASLLARNAADDVLQRAAGRRDVLKAQDQKLAEPGGRYIDFLVPGLIGMGLMGGGLWGVGFAIVDLRIRKLLKRYLATPMRRSDFLGAVMISRLLFVIPEILVLLLFAWLVFGVRIHGSFALLSLFIFLGALQFSGIGLLVACRARTLETVSGLMNLVMLPMWIGSGIFFSVERFPAALQPVLKLLPLTPLIDAIRRVMLEGAGLAPLMPELAIIVAWSAMTFALALRFFRWS